MHCPLRATTCPRTTNWIGAATATTRHIASIAIGDAAGLACGCGAKRSIIMMDCGRCHIAFWNALRTGSNGRYAVSHSSGLASFANSRLRSHRKILAIVLRDGNPSRRLAFTTTNHDRDSILRRLHLGAVRVARGRDRQLLSDRRLRYRHRDYGGRRQHRQGALDDDDHRLISSSIAHGRSPVDQPDPYHMTITQR